MKKHAIIIAEAGVNHNGSLDVAKQLIDVASECGADFVKFQTGNVDNLVTETAKMADYQIANIGSKVGQKEMLKKLMLPYSDFDELYKHCIKRGIKFLSTPFDIESIEYLERFNMTFWKIPSGEITNYPYLVKIGQSKLPVILSTGMSNLQEIRNAIEVLKSAGCPHVSILHCNTDYPTKMEDVNLNVMKTLKDEFQTEVGYSDHTLGIEVPIAAVAMGATIIEKHFTLDRKMDGPDHKCSLEPNELKQMIQSIRNIEKALGNSEKRATEAEMKNINVARKSIVSAMAIYKGQKLDESCITTKRPGTGINPMFWKNIIGKSANRDYEKDELIDGCMLNEN